MIEDIRVFQELSEQLGSSFAATMYIAAEARKLAESYDNVISHSEALNWVVTGVRPTILDRINVTEIHTDTSKLDILNYIDDEEVKAAVRCSYEASCRSRNLVYEYNQVSDESRQTRIRVITRLIWYGLDTQLERRISDG